MNFIRLKSPEDGMYPEAIALYKESFPYHEQREEESRNNILELDEYHFDLIYDDGQFVGIILYWETPDFIYVEHFCIDPEIRGKQYGQKALALLQERQKTVILEIDPPVDDISIRRRSFYERSGYFANSFDHIHPPYHLDSTGHRLMIMSSLRPVTDREYDDFNNFLKCVVMGR